MAYVPHALVAFGGHLGTAPDTDIFVCTVRVAQQQGKDISVNGSLDDPVAYMNQLQPKLSAWWATSSAWAISAQASLEWLKVNNLNSAGHYSGAGTNLYTYPTPVVGHSTVLISADQNWVTSLASSWTTTQARGTGSHGRVYLPWSIPGGFNPFVSSANQAGFLAAAKSFLSQFLAPVGGVTNGIIPVVATKGSVKKGTPGNNYAITGVRMGRVMDVQRRRRSALAESYTATTFP